MHQRRTDDEVDRDVVEETTEELRRDPEAQDRAVPFPARADVRSVALTGLFLLALLYTMYLASSFLLPVVTGVLFAFLFYPVVRRLKRWRVPEWLSATVIVLGLVGVLGWGGYKLTGQAAQWMARAPQVISKVEQRLVKLRRPVEEVTRTAEKVGELATVPSAPGEKAVKVQVKDSSVADALFGGTSTLLADAFVMFVLLYFLLASGDLFLMTVVKVLPSHTDKTRAVTSARETEDQVSEFLVVETAINVVFGAVVGVAVHLCGMPNPVLWGVLAAATNYVPYIGGLVMNVVLGLAALLQFDDVGKALLVAGVFFVLNTLEGNVVTPLILGQRLTLNPVVVFLGVLFWGWMWGIVGTVLAVPILSTIKIVCDHVEGLGPVGEFLGP